MRLAALALVACLLAPVPVLRAQEALTPAQRRAVEDAVVETLRKRPELVLEALEALDARREAETRDRARAALVEKKRELFDDADAPVAGNPAAGAAIVEFFDYRCPYCKQMHAPIKALLADDRDLRIVRKDIPILGPDSVVASRAALAARAQGRYPAMHDALMEYRGNLDEAAVFRVARDAGLDVERLRRDMDAPAVAALIRRNMALAQALGIGGTPAFVIGETLVPGAIDGATLRKLVAEARAKR
jgi:protein-disulfide isomerase